MPAQFDGVDYFSEGLAAVKINGKYGYRKWRLTSGSSSN
ncbi:WG repeat-containing protein [Sporomusa rhizae]